MEAVKLSVPLGFSKKVRTRWASPPNLSLLLKSFSMFQHSPFTKGAELVSYKVSYRTQKVRKGLNNPSGSIPCLVVASSFNISAGNTKRPSLILDRRYQKWREREEESGELQQSFKWFSKLLRMTQAGPGRTAKEQQ